MIEWILQCLEQENRGPALKNALVGDAEMHNGLSIENLREQKLESSISGTLPLLIKGTQSIFWRFYQFTLARRGNIEMVKWIGKSSLLLSRVRDAWMDMLPVSVMSQEQRENQYLADVA